MLRYPYLVRHVFLCLATVWRRVQPYPGLHIMYLCGYTIGALIACCEIVMEAATLHDVDAYVDAYNNEMSCHAQE